MLFSRELSVCLTNKNSSVESWEVCTVLLKCLQTLPNLRVFSVDSSRDWFTHDNVYLLRIAFEGKIFPGVRHVMLEDRLSVLLRSFPNTQALTLLDNAERSTTIDLPLEVEQYCPRIETIVNAGNNASFVRCA